MSDSKTAFSLLQAGRYLEAAAIFRRLINESHFPDQEYNKWLEGLAQSLQGGGHNRAAAAVLLYLHQFDRGLSLLTQEDLVDAARILQQQGRLSAAAERYRYKGKLMLAAICYEQGQQDAEARECWLQARELSRHQCSTYEAALIHFNLGYCCQRLDHEDGMGYLIAAQSLLEEAADDFETTGLRERAFDCYQILLEMGQRSGVFENLSEGYLNCIRILKEDGLKYYVLQYYEDFLQAALKREEYHAAASLYQEAADYCLRLGLLYDRRYLRSAAETWLQAAAKTLSEKGPAEMSENACLAAVECFNTIGDYHGVGRAYQFLSQMDLLPRKKKRYAGIAARYASVPPPRTPETSLPDHLRQSHAYPEIWYHDLVELEHAGDVEAVCGQVVGDRSYPEVVRRRALAVLIEALVDGADTPAKLARLAEGLGDLQVYVVLSPLERLLQHASPEVHLGVMKALRYLFFKRTFGLLRAGLDHDHPRVRQEAINALGRLHFRHAFDPLVRIFRGHGEEDIRSTTLKSIGQIPSLEAGDFLIEVLRHEPEPLRTQAKQLLIEFEDRELIPVLRQHVEMESGKLKQDLAEILRQMGG